MYINPEVHKQTTKSTCPRTMQKCRKKLCNPMGLGDGANSSKNAFALAAMVYTF
jgi:hypothetical protein